MTAQPARNVYPPLQVVKPLAQDVFVVDGPEIGFGPEPVSMPFPTRMTVIRLSSGDLMLHSPVEPTDELFEAVAELGRVRHLIGPNRIHYWWLKAWRERFPDAETWLAPCIAEQAEAKGAAERVDFPAETLDRQDGYPWDGSVATLPVAGSYMTEIVFLHRESATLVLTDLIENFEPEKLSLPMRVLTWIGAAQGSMPRDMRLTYGDRVALISAVETMISWQPERIVVAHGGIYGRDGTAALKRAFSWLLD